MEAPSYSNDRAKSPKFSHGINGTSQGPLVGSGNVSSDFMQMFFSRFDQMSSSLQRRTNGSSQSFRVELRDYVC